MNFDQAEHQLTALSAIMLKAADEQDWGRVAELHESLQNQLQTLFGGVMLPADDRPARLIKNIQQLSESLSFQARAAQNSCAKQLDQTRHKRRGMTLYQETAAEYR